MKSLPFAQESLLTGLLQEQLKGKKMYISVQGFLCSQCKLENNLAFYLFISIFKCFTSCPSPS